MATLQEQLKKARLALDQAKSVQTVKESNTKDTRYIKFEDRPQAEREKLLAELTAASEKVNQAQAYYNNLQTALTKEQQKKAVTGEKEGMSEEKQAALAGQTPEEFRASKQAALDKAEEEQAAANAGAADLKAAATYSQFINTIVKDENQLREVQADLKKNFPGTYTGGTNGLKDWVKTQVALESIAERRTRLPKDLQGADLRIFLMKPIEGFDIGAGGGAGGAYATISDPTQAASLIKSAFKSNLNREATPEEVTRLTKILNSAEKKNPSKTVNGITTGGIDRMEFLAQEIQKLPEFTTKKQERTGLVSNSVQAIARANGVNLGADQLAEWTTAIENGTDPEVIKTRIRTIAGYGMPDNIKQMLADGTDLATIYDPYRRTMASVLEINPEDINLNDSLLRSAIGSDKEMPLYEFQKQLKKDDRWQYTNNARQEVSKSALKILQDFGFQG